MRGERPDRAGVSHVYAATARPRYHSLPLLRVGDPDEEMAMKCPTRAHQHGTQPAVPQIGDKFLFNRTPALFAIGVERDHVMSQRDAEGPARSDGVGDRSPAAILIVGADIHGTRLGLPNSPNELLHQPFLRAACLLNGNAAVVLFSFSARARPLKLGSIRCPQPPLHHHPTHRTY